MAPEKLTLGAFNRGLRDLGLPTLNRADLAPLVVLVVFGGEEWEKVEKILQELSPDVREQYMNATTYHDGKWLAVVVDSDEVQSDIERLLAIKRKPKRA